MRVQLKKKAAVPALWIVGWAAAVFVLVSAVGWAQDSPPAPAAPLHLFRDKVEQTRIAEIAASKNGNFPLAPMQEIQARGGLPNIFAKLERGEDAVIVYYGTSVTAPPGWRAMTFEWLQKQFPRSRLKMVNASVGGTGSLVGAFRADTDLIPAKPDLVFIEFAGNDNPDATRQPTEVLRAMEGIVRKVWRSNPTADICLAYAFGSGDWKTLLAGNTPRGGSLHELVAGHYQLPSIQMSLGVAKLERDGKLVNRAPMTADGRTPEGQIIFTTDGSHPTIPLGHGLWAETVERALSEMRGAGTPGPHALPPPLLADNWENAKTISLEGHALLKGSWDKLTATSGPAANVEGRSIYDWIPGLYHTSTPGSALTLRFKGTHLGLKGVTGPDSGILGIQVDEQPPSKDCQFTVYSKGYSYSGKPLPEMADGVHTVTWTLLDEKPDKLKILTSPNKPGNERDAIDHPEKYARQDFYAGEILIVGDILPVEGTPR